MTRLIILLTGHRIKLMIRLIILVTGHIKKLMTMLIILLTGHTMKAPAPGTSSSCVCGMLHVGVRDGGEGKTQEPERTLFQAGSMERESSGRMVRDI